MLKRDVWRGREGRGEQWAWQDSLLNIYVFIYMDSLAIYKVRTSTKLHGGPVADGHVALESSS